MRTININSILRRINRANYELKKNEEILVEIQDLVDLKLYIEGL